MSNLPWQPGIFGRVSRDPGGGELQTDVMRFMAILAFCLVAIFALVQSIPPGIPQSIPDSLVPAAAPEPRPAPAPTEVVAMAVAPEPRPPAPLPERVRVPEPVPPPERAPRERAREQAEPLPAAPKPAPAQSLVEEPLPEMPPRAAPQSTAPEPVAPASPPSPAQVGFTLRFESDQALERLVAAGEVKLYASVRDRTWRMAAGRGRVSFFPASVPGRVHEMAPETVPVGVVRALRRSVAVIEPQSVTWGVVLPARTRRELMQLMQDQRGGSLIIAPDGAVSLEGHG